MNRPAQDIWLIRIPTLFILSALFWVTPVHSQVGPTGEASLAGESSRAIQVNKFVPGRVLVIVDPSLEESESERVTSIHGSRSVGRDTRFGLRVLELPAGVSEEETVQALRSRPGVIAAELDQILEPSGTPNDPLFPSQAHLTALKAPAAWLKTTGSPSIVVAVIDTGVNGNHPDLAGRLVPGWNTYDNNADYNDVYGHGTKVAGTIVAASNNGVGVASICWDCMLMPIRASQVSGSASFSALAAGLTWAADHGARIANISYQVSSSSTVTAAAQYFMQKGGLVFASAGNYSTNDPAADNPYIVTVSGIDPASGSLYSWSNYGNNIDVTAPGCVGSTTMMNLAYGSGCGTSYSSPNAAGVAALILSANPNLTPAQALKILKDSATDLGTAGWDIRFGYGMVDAEKAVTMALSTTTTDTKGPSVSIAAPTAGTKAKGALAASASAVDAEGSITSVTFKVGATEVCTFAAAPYSCSIDTTRFPDGTANFAVVAVDSSANSTTAQASFTIENADTTKPVVNLSSPGAGAVVKGSTTVQFSATDDVGVSGITVTAGATAVCSVAGTATACQWDTTRTPNGAVALTVTARDAAGNTQAASTTVNVNNVDAVPPVVAIQSPGDGAVVSGTLSISFADSDDVGVTSTVVTAGSTTLCTVSGPATACTWNTLLGPNGPAVVTVAARDAAGNATTASISVNVSNADTTKPAVSMSSPSAGATLSGTVNITFTSSDNVGVTSITVTAGTSTLCSLSGTANSCAWNTTLVANGAYTLTVTARDAAGNTQSATAGVTVSNADTQKPALNITSPAEGSTVSGTINITFAATDNVGVTGLTVTAGSSTLCSLAGTATSCSWNTTQLPNTLYTITVSARDAAGNTQTATRNVTVSNADKTAPSVNITNPASNAKVAGVVSVTFTATDNVAVNSVTVSIGGSTICTLPGSSTSCSWDSAKTANGSQTITVTAKDAAGNSQSAARSVTVDNTVLDTVKPTVTVTSPAAGSTVRGTVSVGMNATDNVKVTKLVLSVNGATICTLTVASGACSWNTATAPNGGATLFATAYDAAGNAGVAQVVVTVANTDLIAPTVRFLTPTGGKVQGDLSIQVSASDNIGVANIMVTANGKPICNLGAELNSCTWNTATFPNGPHSLVATARDLAGNASSASVSVNVNNNGSSSSADKVKPMSVITSPGTGSVINGVIGVNFAAYDNKEVSKVIVRVDTYTVCTLTTASGTCVVDTRQHADGYHNIIAVAYDRTGNASLGYIQVRIANTAKVADAPQVLEAPTLDELDEDITLNPEPEPEPEPGEPGLAPEPENPQTPEEPRIG